MSKKESFIQGTIILAAAALVARVLGLVQRVPLEHIFGAVGNASYTVANTVYLMVLTVATAGIPSTLSKMVSERYALDRPEEARRVYHAALIFACFTGAIMTILVYGLAPYYATYVADVPEAAIAIRAIAPALLLFPALAMMRGYFQGRNNMKAGAISQIVEQIMRVATAILLAFVLLRAGYSDEWVAGGASFGGVLGSIGAFGVMLYYTMKMRRQDRSDGLITDNLSKSQIPFGQIYKDIFKLSIPIVLASMAVPMVNFIDSSIVKPLLNAQVGADMATMTLGILGSRAQSIAGIPPILSIALSASLVPIISAAFARKEFDHMRKQVTMALRVSILTGMPIVIILATAAYSINGLLFSSLDGSGIIALLTIGTIFQITMSTSSGILLGVNKANVPMINVMIGVVVKLIGSFALAPLFGIYGIIGSTGICFFVITLLNLRALKKIISFSILGDRWLSFILTVLVLAGAGYGLNLAGIQMVSFMPDRIAYFITCCIVGLVLIAIYPVMLVLLRVVRQDEMSSYPSKLQKILRPLMRLQRNNHTDTL